MLLTSFAYTWLDQFHATTTNTGALDALAQGEAYNWRPNQRLFGDEGKETSTLWNYKVIGRYTFPWEIGFSGSWKVQSGRQYGRSTQRRRSPATSLKASASRTVTANRAPTVSASSTSALDKSFSFGRYGRLTRHGGHLQCAEQRHCHELLDGRPARTISACMGILDPRIVRFGVRYEF